MSDSGGRTTKLARAGAFSNLGAYRRVHHRKQGEEAEQGARGGVRTVEVAAEGRDFSGQGLARAALVQAVLLRAAAGEGTCS